MAVVDVASLGVTVEAQGVDATRAALEGIEALGQRVGRTVGQITLRLSGADVVAQQARSVGESVSRTLGAAVPPIAVRFTTPGADNALAIVQGARREAEALAAGLGVEAAAARVAASAEAELARARESAARAAGTSPVAAPVAGVVGTVSGDAGASATRQAAASDALTAAIARADAAVTAAGDAAVEAARESATLAAVLDREAEAARRAAAEEAALAQARQRAGAVASPSPSGGRPPAGPRELGPATSSVERNDAAVARNATFDKQAAESQARLAAAVERTTRLVREHAAELNVTSARAVAAFKNSTDAAAAYLLKLGATDAQLDALGASIAEVDARATAATAKTSAIGDAKAGAEEAKETAEAVGDSAEKAAEALQNTGKAAGAAGGQAQAGAAKFRSAANGLTVLAFAAASGGNNFQSMALAAGLAASSLAELGGRVGAVAGSLGAGITIGAAFIGILEQIRKKRQEALLKDIVDPRFTRSADEARATLAQVDRQAALLQKRIADLRDQPFAITGGFGWEGAFFGPARAAARALDDLRERRAELVKQRAEPLAAEEAEQRRQATIGGLQAENSAVAAAADARLAAERTRYEQGRSDLASYTDARVASIRAGAAREIDELRAQQRALRDDTAREPGKVGTTETKAARDARLAEASQIDAQIRAARYRATGEEAQARAERESGERALAQRIRGYDQQIAQARGDTHGATMAQIRAEAAEYARTLAQREPAGNDEARRAAQAADVARFVETRTAAAQAAEAQRVLAREQSALGEKRATIQAQVAKGTLTEVDGQRAIAAAERERLPALTAQLAILERIALALGNPDLLAFVRQMRGELAGWGEAVSPLQARLNGIFNDLASRGTATAAAVTAKIKEMVAAAGGAVTPQIAFRGEQLASMGAQLDAGFMSLGAQVAQTFGRAFADGIQALGEGPITFKNFFSTMGNSLLEGLGSTFMSLGEALLAYGAIMSAFIPLFGNPFTSGPAALAAGAAMIALGATFSAIASKNGKKGGGGGGGSISAPASFDQSASVILTPRAAGKAPAPQPIVQIGNVQILSPNDPTWQRQLSESVQGGVRRGLKFGMVPG